MNKKEKRRNSSFFQVEWFIIGLVISAVPVGAVIAGKGINGYSVLIFAVGIFCISVSVSNFIRLGKKSGHIRKMKERDQFIFAEYDHVDRTVHRGGPEEPDYCTYAGVFLYQDERRNRYFFKTKEYKDRYDIPYTRGDITKIYVDLSYPDVYRISGKETFHSDDPKYRQVSGYSDIDARLSGLKVIISGFILITFAVMGLVNEIPKRSSDGSEANILIALFAAAAVGGIAVIIKGIVRIVK